MLEVSNSSTVIVIVNVIGLYNYSNFLFLEYKKEFVRVWTDKKETKKVPKEKKKTEFTIVISVCITLVLLFADNKKSIAHTNTYYKVIHLIKPYLQLWFNSSSVILLSFLVTVLYLVFI